MTIEKHVQILGILHIIRSGLLILLAGGLFFLFAGIGVISHDEDAFFVLSIIGTILAFILLFIGVPGLVAGIALLKYCAWGRILALVVGFLSLLDIPLGTALGIYTIWVLFKDDAERLFSKPGSAVVPATQAPPA